MVTIATDAARHDRMLDYTQGDATALAEVADAQQLLLQQARPRLADLGVLAVHRDRLAARNQAMPERLPGLWVQLGQPQRALAFAPSLREVGRQARALAGVAEALAGAGQFEEAERVARGVADPHWQAEALAGVAGALAGAGLLERAAEAAAAAERVARGVAGPDRQAEALLAVAESRHEVS